MCCSLFCMCLNSLITEALFVRSIVSTSKYNRGTIWRHIDPWVFIVLFYIVCAHSSVTLTLTFHPFSFWVKMRSKNFFLKCSGKALVDSEAVYAVISESLTLNGGTLRQCNIQSHSLNALHATWMQMTVKIGIQQMLKSHIKGDSPRYVRYIHWKWIVTKPRKVAVWGKV